MNAPIPDTVTLTAVPGLLVGHAVDEAHGTGCTVILCPEGRTPGVHVPGFAPGSREIELMRAESLVDAVHGLALAGGSAFGLAACQGVVRFLVERGCGLDMPDGRIPLVPGAVIYDLDGNPGAGMLSYAALGYEAAVRASAAPVAQGRVGAGRGARCGRLFARVSGLDCPTAPGGVGSAVRVWNGMIVGALVVVNALGNVHDPDTGEWLAGGVDNQGRRLSDAVMYAALAGEIPRGNTVLAVVGVSAPLDKTAANRVARMAAAGLPRVIRPAHLLFDGDVVFALAPRPDPERAKTPAHLENLLGALGAEAVAHAAARAVRAAPGSDLMNLPTEKS